MGTELTEKQTGNGAEQGVFMERGHQLEVGVNIRQVFPFVYDNVNRVCRDKSGYTVMFRYKLPESTASTKTTTLITWQVNRNQTFAQQQRYKIKMNLAKILGFL